MTIVLILTNSNDGSHTDVVVEKIFEHGSSVIRLDTDKISVGEHRLSWSDTGEAMLTTEDESFLLSDANSVWLRRPRVFSFSVVDPVQRANTESEFRAFLSGIYATLGDKRWLNKPEAIERARLKVLQLKLARKMNFIVPESIITADPEEARRFCADGPTVFKPLAEPNIANGDKPLLIPTTLMTERHIDKLDLIRNQYVLLQRFVDKQYELRMTFVDGKLFTAIQTPSDESLAKTTDWRLLQVGGKSSYKPYQVDEKFRNRVLLIMEELCLNFATLDFAIDYEGRCFFLEINPNGQWYGYTDEIGMPASTAIADFLTSQ